MNWIFFGDNTNTLFVPSNNEKLLSVLLNWESSAFKLSTIILEILTGLNFKRLGLMGFKMAGETI